MIQEIDGTVLGWESMETLILNHMRWTREGEIWYGSSRELHIGRYTSEWEYDL